MKADIPYNLIAKQLAGECSSEEIQELEHWKLASITNKEVYEQIKCTWIDNNAQNYSPDVESALNKVSNRISENKSKTWTIFLPWIRIAAVLIIGFGILGLFLLKPWDNTILVATNENQAPYNLVLPDGSNVLLNQNSSIKYPKKFKGTERTIYFEGEAYFKITPNKARPFIINSGNTVTRVLGTEFNLKAVKSEKTVRITVTEGLVSFSDKKQEIKVAAGEMGEINLEKGQVLKTKNTDKNFLAWKTGQLNFDGQPFGEVAKTLSEFYKVEFIVKDSTLKYEPINADFPNINLEQAISNLEMMLENVKITLDNKKVIIQTDK